MKGVELSKLFYQNIVRPWLGDAFPRLVYDAGIFGYGSELLGFDDDMSRDHNWGPRVQLVLTRADFAVHATAIVGGFDAVKPAVFLGEPIGYRSRPHPPIVADDALGRAAHGVEVFTVAGILRTRLALDPAMPMVRFGLCSACKSENAGAIACCGTGRRHVGATPGPSG